MTSQELRLAAELDGKTVLIPNLMKTFPEEWQYSLRLDLLDRVNVDIDAWLTTLDIVPDKLSRHRRKGNYALVAVCMYSRASHERLVTLSKCIYLFFLIDDAIDHGGDFARNQPETMSFCAQVRACIEDCLGPDRDTPSPTPPPDAPEIIVLLYPILMTIQDGMDQASCHRLASDFLGYINAVEAQQTLRMADALPNIDEYLRLRAGDIGVRWLITENEYAMSFALPQDVYDSAPMREILRLAVELVVLANDLLSLQKEIGDGQLDNIVTLLVAQGSLSLDEAVAAVVTRMQEGYARFAEATRELGVVDEKGSGVSEETWEYVLGARAVVIGNLMWSINCDRYFNPSQINSQGEILLKLRVPGRPCSRLDDGLRPSSEETGCVYGRTPWTTMTSVPTMVT